MGVQLQESSRCAAAEQRQRWLQTELHFHLLSPSQNCSDLTLDHGSGGTSAKPLLSIENPLGVTRFDGRAVTGHWMKTMGGGCAEQVVEPTGNPGAGLPMQPQRESSTHAWKPRISSSAVGSEVCVYS